MLTVKYREHAGQTEKVFVAHKVTYIGSQGEFALYDVDDEIKVFIKPARLEVQAVVNVDVD